MLFRIFYHKKRWFFFLKKRGTVLHVKYSYIKRLRKDVNTIKTYGLKALSVVGIYVFILLISGLLVGNEIGQFGQGMKLVLYGFYFFTYSVFSLKHGFPIVLKEETSFLFWVYTIIGLVVYVGVIFSSHYYVFSKWQKRKKVLIGTLVFLNIVIVSSYLVFTYLLVGFA